MEETLSGVQLIHRLVVALTLTLVVLGMSIHEPDEVYAAAKHELNTLEGALADAFENINAGYQLLYKKSELNSAVLLWLTNHNATQKEVPIQVDDKNLTLPDASTNPGVTLADEVKWADASYLHLVQPLFLCEVKQPDVFQALDQLFSKGPLPKLVEMKISVPVPQDSVLSADYGKCRIVIVYEGVSGDISGVRIASLDIPTSLLLVSSVGASIDLNIPDIFKGKGLGDWEENRFLHVPNLRALSTEIYTRTVTNASAYLDEKQAEEDQKSQEKIDIFGQTISGDLTSILASCMLFGLLLYLLFLITHVRSNMTEHQELVRASPFFGLRESILGRLILFGTVLVFPLVSTAYILIVIFPGLHADLHGMPWFSGVLARYAIILAIGISGALSVLLTFRTHTAVIATPGVLDHR